MAVTHHPQILVMDPSTGMYAFADIDPENHVFTPGRTLVDPLSTHPYGFEFRIDRTSESYHKGKAIFYFPSDEDIQHVAAETIAGVKTELEQKVTSCRADAALVEIIDSFDGNTVDRGANWVITGRAILLKYGPTGPYTQQRK